MTSGAPSRSIVLGVTRQLAPLAGILQLAEYFALDCGILYEQLMYLFLRFATERGQNAAGSLTGRLCDALDAYMFDLVDEAGDVFPIKLDSQEEAAWRFNHVMQQSSMFVISEVMQDYLKRVAFCSGKRLRVGKSFRGDQFRYQAVFLVGPRLQTIVGNNRRQGLRTDMSGPLSNTRENFATAFWQSIPWARITLRHLIVRRLAAISELRPRLPYERSRHLATVSGYYRRLTEIHVATPYQQPYLWFAES